MTAASLLAGTITAPRLERAGKRWNRCLRRGLREFRPTPPVQDEGEVTATVRVIRSQSLREGYHRAEQCRVRQPVMSFGRRIGHGSRSSGSEVPATPRIRCRGVVPRPRDRTGFVDPSSGSDGSSRSPPSRELIVPIAHFSDHQSGNQQRRSRCPVDVARPQVARRTIIPLRGEGGTRRNLAAEECVAEWARVSDGSRRSDGDVVPSSSSISGTTAPTSAPLLAASNRVTASGSIERSGFRIRTASQCPISRSPAFIPPA